VNARANNGATAASLTCTEWSAARSCPKQEILDALRGR